jgi:hypothetical protein
MILKARSNELDYTLKIKIKKNKETEKKEKDYTLKIELTDSNGREVTRVRKQLL